MPDAELDPRAQAWVDKARGGTWLDWLIEDDPVPDDSALLTRDVVIGQLARRGLTVSERSIQRWETLGVVPRPVHRVQAGRLRSLYHPAAAELLAGMVGRSIDDADVDRITSENGRLFSLIAKGLHIIQVYRDDPAIQAAIASIQERFNQTYPNPLTRVVLELWDATGMRQKIPLDV